MNLVFDFAGVLFHWDPLALIRRELPAQAADDTSARWWLQHFFEGFGGDWGEFDRGTLDEPELVPRIARRTGLHAEDVRRVVQAVPRALVAYPPMVQTLQALRAQGHRLLYLSNMPKPYADRLERENAFLAWFDDGVISARVGAIKPEREIFAIAERRFGVAAADLLFFDDVVLNVQSARDAGWRAERFVDAPGVLARVAAGAQR